MTKLPDAVFAANVAGARTPPTKRPIPPDNQPTDEQIIRIVRRIKCPHEMEQVFNVLTESLTDEHITEILNKWNDVE